MEERVVDFVNGLRGRWVSVSTAESLDAMRSLLAVGIADPSNFRAALRAALIKRNQDQVIFEELFPLYFHALGAATEAASELGEDLVQRIMQEPQDLFSQLLSGNSGEWESWIRQMAGDMDFSRLMTRMQVGMFTRRIFDSIDWDNMGNRLRELQSSLSEEGWPDSEVHALPDVFAANREAFRRQVRSYVEREQARNADQLPSPDRVERLMNRPLSSLEETELQQMRQAVDILARKLRNKMALRDKRAKRGRLDVKATMRKNMHHGGIPFNLVRRKKRKEKADLMVLCDISSSVSRVSQFMLQFVYTVQDCLAKVRSFVFVDALGEVTSFFRDEDIGGGVRLALSEASIPYNVRSDFGWVFQEFCERYLQDVGYRTYILIIGDARNNYNDPAVWALEKMAERAKGIIWLNPETKPFWNTGDSVMEEYLPYCREARVCRTLKDLEETVSSLLL
ncbi:MAG: hypothetical protein A2W01_00780 [Candidatus Solincola sediminis]|nr:MAG: hypothetical protein A2W01_00780 [Candidatus Solincola sediminis]